MDWQHGGVRGRLTRAGYQGTILPDEGGLLPIGLGKVNFQVKSHFKIKIWMSRRGGWC
jgi:hypothetical protein